MRRKRGDPICSSCEALDSLSRIERELRHIRHQNDEILAALVADPTKLAELTARLNAKTKAVNDAVAANPIPQ